MKTKSWVFASAGSQDDSKKNQQSFTGGMIANTVAYAEDVNTYGNISDAQLKIVSDELCNALINAGITPDETGSNVSQLSTLLRTKIGGAFALTGIKYSASAVAPSQNGNTITFPAFTVVFNNSVYYGSVQSDFTTVEVPQRQVSGTSAWADGVHYIYVDTSGQIGHQQTAVSAADASSKCLLGSVFVISGQFQASSFKYHPWLQVTSKSTREAPAASIRGGLISPLSGTEVEMGALQIEMEGIIYSTNAFSPDVSSVAALSPFEYKFLYPDYNPSAVPATEIDTTHIYNMSAETWDDISALAGKYIIMVPCVVPTGQTLIIPAMSYKVGGEYTQVFDTQDEAEAAIFGLQYTDDTTDKTRERAIYLGQSMIVRVGATDFTDGAQFKTVGNTPQALSAYTKASGESGGTGAYVPMPEYTWPASALNITLKNNYSNVILGSQTNSLSVTPPSNTQYIMNSCLVKYTHVSGNKTVAFNNVRWWTQAPNWVTGCTYMFTFDFVNGYWYVGYCVYQG